MSNTLQLMAQLEIAEGKYLSAARLAAEHRQEPIYDAIYDMVHMYENDMNKLRKMLLHELEYQYGQNRRTAPHSSWDITSHPNFAADVVAADWSRCLKHSIRDNISKGSHLEPDQELLKQYRVWMEQF